MHILNFYGNNNIDVVQNVVCHAEHREASRKVTWQSPCAGFFVPQDDTIADEFAFWENFYIIATFIGLPVCRLVLNSFYRCLIIRLGSDFGYQFGVAYLAVGCNDHYGTS